MSFEAPVAAAAMRRPDLVGQGAHLERVGGVRRVQVVGRAAQAGLSGRDDARAELDVVADEVGQPRLHLVHRLLELLPLHDQRVVGAGQLLHLRGARRGSPLAGGIHMRDHHGPSPLPATLQPPTLALSPTISLRRRSRMRRAFSLFLRRLRERMARWERMAPNRKVVQCETAGSPSSGTCLETFTNLMASLSSSSSSCCACEWKTPGSACVCTRSAAYKSAEMGVGMTLVRAARSPQRPAARRGARALDHRGRARPAPVLPPPLPWRGFVSQRRVSLVLASFRVVPGALAGRALGWRGSRARRGSA